jgi:heme exporter protein D
MKKSWEQILSYIGSAITAMAGWGISEWSAFLGILMGLSTYITGRIYQKKRDARETAAHAARQAREAGQAAARARQADIDYHIAELKAQLLEARKNGIERREYNDPASEPARPLTAALRSGDAIQPP